MRLAGRFLLAFSCLIYYLNMSNDDPDPNDAPDPAGALIVAAVAAEMHFFNRHATVEGMIDR